MSLTGRQHSATNGCFREVKNQRPLFGDELEEMSVAFRPRAAVELLGKLSFNVLAQGREAGLPAERPSGAVG